MQQTPEWARAGDAPHGSSATLSLPFEIGLKVVNTWEGVGWVEATDIVGTVDASNFVSLFLYRRNTTVSLETARFVLSVSLPA